MGQTNAAGNGVQYTDPSHFPGVEIANEDNWPDVMSQFLFELKHLIEEGASQAEVDAVAVKDKQ
jgi:hypothetical protein